MTFIQAIILGTLQGIAEFLPVSSSGHLVVFKSLLAIGDIPVLFDVLLHIATLCATLIVFRKTIFDIILSCFKWIRGKAQEIDRERVKLVGVLLVATAVTAVLGYFIDKINLENSPKIVSGLLLATAVILFANIFFRGRKGYGDVTFLDGAIIGIAQGIGVFPGISRSGITITAAQACGIEREKAGEVSFLISIPAIIGAFILKLKDADILMVKVDAMPMAVAFTTAFVVGLFSLSAFMKLVRRGKIAWFALYLIPAGIIGLIFF